MKPRALLASFIAVSVASFGAVAVAQELRTQTPRQTQIQRPGGLVARSPDLVPIPSRIEHGVVSVRNAGAAVSTPSVVTVNCHLPGEEGGCPDIPAALIAPYENAAYPNRLVVNVPAIQPGHVYNHHLSFWNSVAWPTGSYQFDYVADAGADNGEANEGNNSASHTWVVP